MAAKTLLQRLGYYEAPEWGLSPYPDAALFKAVRAFQSAQGLSADGAIKPDGETETALRDAATRLQSMGRNGDTLLAHITPAEARLLDAVTDGGSINPQTGLLEFWGRMGGSKHSREQRDKADTGADANAASPSGDTGNNAQNESGGSRPRTYTDAQLAGAAKANGEAARTRDKVRSYLDRNGASANNDIPPGIDARAPQQVDAPQTAEPARRREQDTTAAPGVDPSWGPSATPAQQARNIKQTRQFTEQQRAAEANANTANAISRTRVRDYLGIMSQTQKTPGQSPTTARKAAWSEAKNRVRAGLLTELGAPAQSIMQEPPILADKIAWYNSQPDLKTKRTQFFETLQNAGLSAENIRTYVELLDREGGFVKNPNSSAYGGIMSETLSSLISQGRVRGIPLRTEPRNLTPAQVADVYKAYYDGTFYAQNGAATLDKIKDAKAKSMLADALFTRRYKSAAFIVQSGINAVLDTAKHSDNVLGSNTPQDYDALTSNSKTRDRLLNAIADRYWSEIKNDRYIPEHEKRGWKIRIDSLRP